MSLGRRFGDGLVGVVVVALALYSDGARSADGDAGESSLPPPYRSLRRTAHTRPVAVWGHCDNVTAKESSFTNWEALTVSPDGTRLVSGGERSGGLTLWDVTLARPIRRFG